MRHLGIYIATALLIAPALAVSAQEVSDTLVVNDRLVDNSFIYGTAGLHSPYTKALGLGYNGQPSFVMDLGVGKWFSPTFGVRVGLQGFDFKDWEVGDVLLPAANAELSEFNGQPAYTVRTEYNYLHTDVLWNLTNSLFGYKTDRVFTLAPYAHIGYKWLFNSFAEEGRTPLKSDFGGGLGAIASFQVNDNISVFADLRSSFDVRHTLDNYSGKSQMSVSAYGLVGASYDISRNDWSKVGKNTHRGYVVNKAFDNTFIAVSGGFSFYNVTDDTYPFNANPQLLLGVNIGKWYTPSIGVRLGYERFNLSYFSSGEVPTWRNMIIQDATFHGEACKSYTFLTNLFHGDLLWNVSNTFGDYKPSRFYSFIPYASYGLAFSHADKKDLNFRHDFMMGGGLLNSFRIFRHLALNVDLRTYRISNRKYGNTNIKPAWASTASLGLAWNIRPKEWLLVENDVLRISPSSENRQQGNLLADSGFFRNPFLTMGTGFTTVLGGEESTPAPAMEVAFGDWVTPYFGYRLGAAGINDNSSDDSEAHLFAHVDFMPDVIRMVTHGDGSEAFSLVPYVGMGLISKDLGWNAGLLTSLKVGEYASANVDLRYMEANATRYAAGMLGFTYHFGQPDWLAIRPFSELEASDRAANFEKVNAYILNSRIFDNTFFTFSAGVSGLDFDGAAGNVEFNAGKWFTPSVGGRVGYRGRKVARNSGDVYDMLGSNYTHIDLLWNPLAMFSGKNDDRIFDPVLYLQQGVLGYRTPAGLTLGHQYAVGAGFEGILHVADRVALVCDLGSAIVKDPYTRSESEGFSAYSSAMAGLQYEFGATGWKTSDAYRESKDDSSEKSRYWAVSTNLLDYVDLLTLNAEVQYAVDRQWSLSMQGKLNGLTLKKGTDSEIADRKSAVSIGAKFWPWYVYSGWWFKGFVQTENFSRSNLTKKMGFHTGEAYGAGIAAGYSLILSESFNLDFGVGAWGGYRNAKAYDTIDMKGSTARQGSAFVDLADVSVSAMFIF